MIGRGVYYAPRGLQRRKVDEITITQIQDQILSGSQLSSEIELVQIIQEKIIVIDQTKKNKDNIRKNHFANVYNSVNTIIVVVTPVIDNRNSNNKNTRYMTHKVQSNVKSNEQVIVVIQESTPVIIDVNSGNSGNSGKSGASPAGVAQPQSTAAAQVNPNVMTVDPNSMSAISNCNGTMLLPAGVPLPNFGGMQVIQDPAIIIEENQQVFVDFVNQQQHQASIVDINVGGAGVTIISS